MTDEIYGQIPSNFTLEFSIYIDPDQTYPWGYVGLVSNTEGGGFGICYRDSGKIQLDLNISGSYKKILADCEKGKWVHIVATYDNSSMCLYIDGAPVGVIECSGNIKHVADISKVLMVGADVNGEGGVQTISNVKVKFVRLYDKGLSSSTVTELYNDTLAQIQ